MLRHTPSPLLLLPTEVDTGNGGGSIVGAYQINVGADRSFFDFGWGTGTWSAGTWGTARTVVTQPTIFARIWKFDQFGQVLIMQAVNGAILLTGTQPVAQTRERQWSQERRPRAPLR